MFSYFSIQRVVFTIPYAKMEPSLFLRFIIFADSPSEYDCFMISIVFLDFSFPHVFLCWDYHISWNFCFSLRNLLRSFHAAVTTWMTHSVRILIHLSEYSSLVQLCLINSLSSKTLHVLHSHFNTFLGYFRFVHSAFCFNTFMTIHYLDQLLPK